jgi:hypothetical protein
MKLEFTEWSTGHHGHVPEPVEANDIDHAFKIFSAVACALCQGEKVRAKVENGQGEVVARFEAVDDESPSTDYPEPGDLVCSECGAFWFLMDCGCEGAGFVPMEADAVEDLDEEMIDRMNAYLESGKAKMPDTLTEFFGGRG